MLKHFCLGLRYLSRAVTISHLLRAHRFFNGKLIELARNITTPRQSHPTPEQPGAQNLMHGLLWHHTGAGHNACRRGGERAGVLCVQMP